MKDPVLRYDAIIVGLDFGTLSIASFTRQAKSEVPLDRGR